jgi:DNA-binding NarL/FixJ family response regulator
MSLTININGTPQGVAVRQTEGQSPMCALEDINMPKVSKIKVLIAHSDPLIAAGLAATLRRRRDFEVVGCGLKSDSADSTESHSPSRDVVVADYDSGLRLTAAKHAWMDRVMILTPSDSEAKICQALAQGVRGYLLLGCALEELMDGLRSINAGGVALGPLVASRIAHRMKQDPLTRREEEILGHMMMGLSNKRIASQLAVAVGTVKTHVKSILLKLDAASRTEAVAIAQRRGILQQESESPHQPVSVRGLRDPLSVQATADSRNPGRISGGSNALISTRAP